MNKSLIKADWEDSKVSPFPYLHQHPNRRQRRANKGRKFSNKKGKQVVVVNFGRGNFSKVHKDFQHLSGKTIVQYKLIR